MENPPIDPKTYSLCEAVADLAWLYCDAIHDGSALRPSDSREITHRAIEWAAEFEALHADEKWIDRTYLDEIETFFTQKLETL
jgi:hypothetical protein